MKTTLPAKSPAESAVNHNVYKIFPNDLNSKYTVFGGLVMSLCDRTALIVAERHSGRPCVTATLDSLEFLAAAQTGETLIIKAMVNRAWRSSMEIGVRVTAENSLTGDLRHIVSAYLTFVALDEQGKPTAVPPVEPGDELAYSRYVAADERRAQRLARRRK